MSIATTSGSAARRLLDDGRRARAMRWVMAVMLFLTVLACALGIATANVAAALDAQLGGRLVVQIVAGSDAARDAASNRLAEALGAMPEVRAAVPVPRAELAELARPWLGDAGLSADLPMPAMIDIDLRDPSASAVTAVTARARSIAPDARVDRSAGWLAPVRGFVVTLSGLAGGLVLLMASATGGIVLLTARAGLDTHRDTIDVLHMLGSTDSQVARLFQRRIALDTLIGGVVGSLAAAAAIMVIGWRAAGLDSGLVGGASLGTGGWVVLALLPLAFAGLAMVAARVAVLRTLERRL